VCFINISNRTGFRDSDIAGVWLTGARLSRKGNLTGQAYHSVLKAAELKDKSATIEHARLLWKDGHHRKAIQTLDGAIAANVFVSADFAPEGTESLSLTSHREQHQNMLTARVHTSLLDSVIGSY
jgi:serine/threonine-protein kinase ATR